MNSSNPFSSSVDENYNPFDNETEYDNKDYSLPQPSTNSLNFSSQSFSNSAYTSSPSGSQTSQINSFISSSSNGYKDPITGMVYSEAELAKREAILAKREQEIALIESQVQNGTYQKTEPRKNFPPFIKLWEYYPEEELPPASVPIVQRLKWVFYSTSIVYIINWVCCLFCFSPACKNVKIEPGTLIVLSTVYMIILCPLSFECSFFVIYDALKMGKSLKFFCGIITFCIWGLFLALNVVGISDAGSVGFITMINLFSQTQSNGKWIAVMSLIFCIAGVADVILLVLSLIQLMKYWKSEGLDRKAIGEASVMATNYAMENPDIAKNALSVAVNNGNDS